MAVRQRPSTNLPARPSDSTHSSKVVATLPPSVSSVAESSTFQAERYFLPNCSETTWDLTVARSALPKSTALANRLSGWTWLMWH
eukprot:15133737-Alexandrium_andersonii.AAC.1